MKKYKITHVMEKILISACLVGDKTKYDGHSNYCPQVQELLKYAELIPFCPEVEGGLKIPRIPAERNKDKVINEEGKDVTKYYLKGAELALNICKYLDIKYVVLKEKSPSCGVHECYDGSFTHKLVKRKGFVAEYLAKNGITLYSETEIDQLIEKIK